MTKPKQALTTQELKRVYDAVESNVIHHNLSETFREYEVTPKAISKMLGCSIHTAYAYRKTVYTGKPDLIHLMIVSEQLKLDIMRFFEPAEGESADA